MPITSHRRLWILSCKNVLPQTRFGTIFILNVTITFVSKDYHEFFCSKIIFFSLIFDLRWLVLFGIKLTNISYLKIVLQNLKNVKVRQMQYFWETVRLHNRNSTKVSCKCDFEIRQQCLDLSTNLWEIHGKLHHGVAMSNIQIMGNAIALKTLVSSTNCKGRERERLRERLRERDYKKHQSINM